VVTQPDFCCPEGTSCSNTAYDAPDGGAACVVDCDRVCGAVAPGVPKGFRSCGWTTATELSYICGACGVGRVPRGTELCPAGDSVAERLARQAYYEAASVVAFERLTAGLVRAGAPGELVARARAAARDEERHAALFAALANKHGARPTAPALSREAPSLFELALENATEGCVREAFGALVTLHQAEHAAEAEVRSAFAAIAEDEAEHAALSWELRVWFDAALAPAERAAVRAAHDRAVLAARREAAVPPDAPSVALGLPDPLRADRMLDALLGAMAAAA
jgi:rubrerythrin